MAFFDQETFTPMSMRPMGMSEVVLWPDAGLIAQIRREITLGASRQQEDYFPLGRQQLLEVLSSVSNVDAQVLQLIDGIRVCLGGIDISDYRNAIQRLDKPDRTEEENLAFLQYQQEIANVLMQAVEMARRHVAALGVSLNVLQRLVVDDNRVLISELESRLGNQPAGEPDVLVLLLEELRGPGQVAVARDRYAHEISKLIVAMGDFFDNVLEGRPGVIQRAEDFAHHAGRLLADLQRLRDSWES